jgi:hypothetical protein
MTGRHTRRPAWLTRLRAPLATTSVGRELPEFRLDSNPLSEADVRGVLNRIAGGLWLTVLAGPKPFGAAKRTEKEALEHLAPRRRTAKSTFASRLRNLRPPTFTGSVLRPPSERVYRAGFSALLGVLIGYGYGAMTLDAPQSCAKAFTLADRTFVDYENVTTAVVMMKTRGQSEYKGHEADAIQLWDDIDAAKADYRDAKASCVGGAS